MSTVAEYIPGFLPSNCNDWRTESVDLSPWEGQQFILEIESIGDKGNSIFLDEITLVANALPQANIAFPANNTLYIGVGPLQQVMRVEADDSDGEIVQVDFFLGSDFLGSDLTPPYEMPYLMPNWGHYDLQARVTDNEGAQIWTETITVRYDYENSTSFLGNLPVSINLVPNPVNTRAALIIESEASYRGLELTISNPTGQIISQWNSDIGNGISRLDLPVEYLSAGAYWLQVRYEDQQLVLPLVKQ